MTEQEARISVRRQIDILIKIKQDIVNAYSEFLATNRLRTVCYKTDNTKDRLMMASDAENMLVVDRIIAGLEEVLTRREPVGESPVMLKGIGTGIFVSITPGDKFPSVWFYRPFNIEEYFV